MLAEITSNPEIEIHYIIIELSGISIYLILYYIELKDKAMKEKNTGYISPPSNTESYHKDIAY